MRVSGALARVSGASHQPFGIFGVLIALFIYAFVHKSLGPSAPTNKYFDFSDLLKLVCVMTSLTSINGLGKFKKMIFNLAGSEGLSRRSYVERR